MANTIKRVTESEKVRVISMVYGELIWKSAKTNYKLRWPEFGSDNLMTVEELREMRNGSPLFFEAPWVLISDEDGRAIVIMEYLQISKYYKNLKNVSDFDNMIKLSPDELAVVAAPLSESQRQVLVFRAKEMLSSGELDSVKTVEAIERALGVNLGNDSDVER